MKKIKQQAANLLTAFRIVFSFVLLFLEPLSIGFFVVYSLCGLSDMTDGAVARRLKTVSRRGALLDSIADIIFLGVCAARLLPMLLPLLSPLWLYPIAAVCAIKAASSIVGLIRFGRLCLLHTSLNKITGGALFALTFFYKTSCLSALVGAVCVTALLASADELRRVLKMKEYRTK